MRLSALLVALLLTAAAHAQSPADDPDWREADAPPPPAFKLQGLIALDMPNSALRFGVDPASISIGEDGVVRYVVVATSDTGVVNALYEGIRCGKGDFKVYARHSPERGWTVAKGFEWRSVFDRSSPRHTLQVARLGACMGRSPNRSPAQIVRDLRTPLANRYQTE
jgi:hypothetical protein